MLKLLLFLQFNPYYEHNFGKNVWWVYPYWDFNEDGHKDAAVYYNNLQTYGIDSILLYLLPTTQKIAKYTKENYNDIEIVYYFGNKRFLIYRYKRDPSYHYYGKIYYYENYTNLVWVSEEFFSLQFFYPYVIDIDGDNKLDFYLILTTTDSSRVLIIYKGNVSGVNEFNGCQDFNVHNEINKIKLYLSKPGNYIIDFYDSAGRKTGSYYLEGKKGINEIIPPFITNATRFYEVKKDDEILFRGKFIIIK